MFSIHIDTARTWRGGQRQVLLTVLGLRERGHRTVLVAHPEGELAGARVGRARSHPPGAARRGRSARGMEALAHHQGPEARHRACARSARRRPGVARAVVPDRRKMSTAHRVAPRRIPSEGDTRSLAGNTTRWTASSPPRSAIQQMLIGDGIDPDRVVTVYEGIDLHRVQARTGGEHPCRVLAADARADRRRGRGADAGKGPQVPDRCGGARRARGARRAVRDPRRRRPPAGARAAGQGAASRQARRCCPASAPTSCRSSRASTCSS